MPVLPPRNLPLSRPTAGASQGGGGGGRGGGGAPLSPSGGSSSAPGSPSGLGHGKGGPRAAGPATPSRPPHRLASVSPNASPSALRGDAAAATNGSAGTAGTLGRQDETTFHRRLRALLWDHRAARELWEDIVSLQGAKSIAAAARAAASLDEALSHGATHSIRLPAVLAMTPDDHAARQLDDVARAIRALDAERNVLRDMFASRLAKAVSKLEALSDAAEALLVEAVRSRGDEFAFVHEMWTTWPMETFVSAIQLLTSRHTLQTAQLSALVDVFYGEGCAPGGAPEQQHSQTANSGTSGGPNTSKGTREDDEAEDEGEEEAAMDGQPQKHSAMARKHRARVRQRVLETWQALPLLQDERSFVSDAGWFEDICEAEVGRWDER